MDMDAPRYLLEKLAGNQPAELPQEAARAGLTHSAPGDSRRNPVLSRALSWHGVMASTVIVTLLLALTGCAAAKPQTPQPFPDGMYTTADPQQGTLQLRLTQGSYTLELNDPSGVNLIAGGKYVLDGDKVTFTEQRTTSFSACLKDQGTFTYQYAWSATTTALSFKVVKDACAMRSDANTGRAWQLVPPDTLFTIEGTDKATFNPDTLTVKAGQTVNLTLVNNGKLPHTFSVPDLSLEVQMPPGTTNTVTFKAPRAGTYRFSSGVLSEMDTMKGTLIVQ
jgi:plastocyanin